MSKLYIKPDVKIIQLNKCIYQSRIVIILSGNWFEKLNKAQQKSFN